MNIDEGTLLKKLDITRGESERGTWQYQSFILKTHGDYPKTICFDCWGDTIKDLEKYPVDFPLRISYSTSSKESRPDVNGDTRWFTTNKVLSITNYLNLAIPTITETAPVPTNESIVPIETEDDLPF